MGRRKTSTIAGTTTTVLYDGVNPVQEQAGATVANLLTGLSVDEFYMRSSAETQIYLVDALGSTVAMTDAAGTVQAAYSYEPFGATTVAGTSGNRYEFTGREAI